MQYPQSVVELARKIIDQSLSFGASLAGLASVEQLRCSPSHDLYTKIPVYKGATARDDAPKTITWPDDARTALVMAIVHPEDEPELDWWDGRKGTSGNRRLIKLANRTSRWLREELDIKTYKLPYHVEHGGIFLKDAAVLAGLGCVGRNNLLLTPQFGPRIRLRAMLLDRELPPSQPLEFDPCQDCPAPCQAECCRTAFDDPVYGAEKLSQPDLPGRDGHYSRDRCDLQMEQDIANQEELPGDDGPQPCVKYCRLCEFACPVGA
jgi:epoxyqueuosine reductase